MLADSVLGPRLSYYWNCLYDCLIILIISTEHKYLSLINYFSIGIYSFPAKWFLITIIAGGTVAANVRWVHSIVIIHVMTRQSLIVKHSSVQTRLFSEMVQV